MPLVTFVVLFIVPVPLLAGVVPQIVELFHNLWNRDPISAPVPLLGSCSTFLGHCSINCGTVPLFVELFHKKWNCSTLCRSSWILPKISVFAYLYSLITRKVSLLGHMLLHKLYINMAIAKICTHPKDSATFLTLNLSDT